MPVQLNTGWQKNIGETDDSSPGANCHLEVEVEASLVREPDQLRAGHMFFDQGRQVVAGRTFQPMT